MDILSDSSMNAQHLLLHERRDGKMIKRVIDPVPYFQTFSVAKLMSAGLFKAEKTVHSSIFVITANKKHSSRVKDFE